MKKLIPVVLACLLVPAVSAAQYSTPKAPQGPVEQQAKPTPDRILKAGIEDLQAFLNSDMADNKEALVALIKTRIAPQFDMETMARWSGGYWYREMTPEQQQAFTLKLAKSFFASLSNIVGGYAGNMPRVRFMAPRHLENGEVDVSARIYPENNYPVDVRFSFHNTARGWRIFDVSSNGVSAVSFYRKMFNRKVRQYQSIEVLYK